MNMRNATCVRTQTSKDPTRVAILFISYSMTEVLSCSTPFWCYKIYFPHCSYRFQRPFQDKFMSGFVKNGEFSAECVQLPRKKRNLIIVVSWNIVLAMPEYYMLYILILHSSLLVSVPVPWLPVSLKVC